MLRTRAMSSARGPKVAWVRNRWASSSDRGMDWAWLGSLPGLSLPSPPPQPDRTAAAIAAAMAQDRALDRSRPRIRLKGVGSGMKLAGLGMDGANLPCALWRKGCHPASDVRG